MLVDFSVKNYALIEELEINFRDGLNVMTGETGAGKSIIIAALEILLGDRAFSELIRKGKKQAYIEAVFEPGNMDKVNGILSEAGIETDPASVLLSRELRQNGRNRSRINGQLATVGMIKNIGRYLVDIHGQHEHQLLLDSGFHLEILDEFIAFEKNGLCKKVTTLYKKLKDIDEELNSIEIDEAEKAREIDLLEFQIDEIEKAELEKGELEDLNREFKILSNMEDIYAIIGKMINGLSNQNYETAGIIDLLAGFIKELEEIKEYDQELMDFHKMISDCYYILEDLSFQLNNYHENLEFDQERLDIIENRLALITALQRKYGQSIEEILEYKSRMKEKLNKLLSIDRHLEELSIQREKISEKYFEAAKELSKTRQSKARELEKLIRRELKDLAMKDAIFKIDFKQKEPAADGIDRVAFLISTNPGEDLKPVSKIASGGEISRIMLALKTIIAHIDQVDTLIFDEVDSGVGGKTSQMMAEKLSLISRKRQVICITHMPQIASMADNHFYISKEVQEGKTLTGINILDGEGRKKEIARMLGGLDLTDTTLKHAKEMLDIAARKKTAL
ncbi:MAG TPA: DNA repair protein RecN [Halanaerobiales bacterium]|nr:DNA repair protein RecN [Halanaerobiales bacterium]